MGGTYLNIATSTEEETSDIVGLLGNLDGDPGNDLTTRDGSVVLSQDATLDELCSVYLNSWRVTDATSLFDYGAGDSTASCTDLSFPSFPAGVTSAVTVAAEFYPTRGWGT